MQFFYTGKIHCCFENRCYSEYGKKPSCHHRYAHLKGGNQMKKMKMDDDFQSYLTEGAIFEGNEGIPCMLKFSNIKIPKRCIPYTERKRSKDKHVFLHCYIHDFLFSNLITDTKNHLSEIASYDGFICPDPTITIGGSRTINQAQVYFSRAVGFYAQKNGIFAIPCVRWGDRSTYDYCFLGVPKNYIVAISTHGCISPCKENNNELRKAFISGLPIMLERLKPKYVVVYGRMPKEIFNPYLKLTTFINYPSDIQRFYGGRKGK